MRGTQAQKQRSNKGAGSGRCGGGLICGGFAARPIPELEPVKVGWVDMRQYDPQRPEGHPLHPQRPGRENARERLKSRRGGEQAQGCARCKAAQGRACHGQRFARLSFDLEVFLCSGAHFGVCAAAGSPTPAGTLRCTGRLGEHAG